MFKKLLLFALFLISSDFLFSMNPQDQEQVIGLTLDQIPNEITDLIFREILQSSINDLPLPISQNNFLEEPQDNTASLDFIQRYSFMIKNLKLIARKYKHLTLGLQSHINYCLVLKLNTLSADQKINILLRFAKLNCSTLIAAALLSFLDLTNLEPAQIKIKFNLLEKALKQKIISGKSLNLGTEHNLLKIHDINKVEYELLNLLIEIRAHIPLFENSSAYLAHKQANGLSPFEQKCDNYIQSLINKGEYSVETSIDLFDINKFFAAYIAFTNKEKSNYVKMLKSLTAINLNDVQVAHITPLMRTAFNNDLSSVQNYIEQDHDKYHIIHDMNAIYWALLGNAKEVLDYLLPDNEITNQHWINIKNMWNWAIRNCDVSILEYLLGRLHKNLANYELQQVLSQETNFIQDSKWEKPIFCSDEEKFIFLINHGISLKKFHAEGLKSSKSQMMNKLLDHDIKLLQKRIDKLKLKNNIVNSQDIIQVYEKIKQKSLRKKQKRAALLTAISQMPEINTLQRTDTTHNASYSIAKRSGYSLLFGAFIAYLLYCNLKSNNVNENQLSTVLK